MTESILTISAHCAFVIIAVSIVCAFVRLLLGPALADRVVALDLIVVLCVALIAVDAILTGQLHFLRAGITLALIAFLGTVAFAYYLRRVDLSE